MDLPELLAPSRRQTRRADEGFSVVEIAVAIGVFALVAMFLAQTLATGLSGVLHGKRREVATQVANEMLEKARSLSFNAIGHIEPLEPDPAIEAGAYNGESLVIVPDVPGHPFNPHVSDLQRGSTRLTRHVYVTWADVGSNLKRISVRITWDDAGARGGENEVRAETLVNESGLVPTGRAGTPIMSWALASGSFLNLRSELLGLPLAGLNITLPHSTGSGSLRAAQNVTCTTRSTSLHAAGLIDLPGYSATATADDDPRTAIPTESSDQHDGTLVIPDGLIRDLLGDQVVSPVACQASASGQLKSEEGEAGAVEVEAGADVSLLGGVRVWSLVLATIHTQPVIQRVEQQATPNRQSHARSNAGLGGLAILAIPGVIDDGLVTVGSFGFSAQAWGNAGDSPPPSPQSGLSAPLVIRIFDPGSNLDPALCSGGHHDGYCVAVVEDPGSSLEVVHSGSLSEKLGLGPLELLDLDLLEDPAVNLTYSVQVRALTAPDPVDGAEGPSGERRWTASYQPLQVTASLQGTLLGETVIDAAVVLDLGTVRADICAGPTCA